MWELQLCGFDLFYLFYHFFLYSFFGWIYESCLVSFRNKQWVNRGFLNGPVIPIYGAGATAIMMALEPVKNQYVAVFFGGILVASVLEYVTSFVMEKLFHAKWWDYSDWKFNLQGRICLAASLFWGLLSVTMELIFKPGVDKLIADIPRKAGEYAGYVIAVVFTADFVLTVVSTIQLDKKLSELHELRDELTTYLENSKLASMTENWKEKLADFRFHELLSSVKTRLDELTEAREHAGQNDRLAGLRENFSEISENLPDFHEVRAELEERVKALSARYQNRLDRTNVIQKRLASAFPNMKFIGKDAEWKDWTDRVKRHKNDDKNQNSL